jgi:hypothetical protein
MQPLWQPRRKQSGCLSAVPSLWIRLVRTYTHWSGRHVAQRTPDGEDIEPLEPELWLDRLRTLAAGKSRTTEDLERALRHAYHLIKLTPRPLRHLIRCKLDEAEFEALMIARAWDSAALALACEPLGLRVNRAPGTETIEVEVYNPYDPSSQLRTGASLATALFEAWLAYLISTDDVDIRPNPPTPQRDQFALHRKPYSH